MKEVLGVENLGQLWASEIWVLVYSFTLQPICYHFLTLSISVSFGRNCSEHQKGLSGFCFCSVGSLRTSRPEGPVRIFRTKASGMLDSPTTPIPTSFVSSILPHRIPLDFPGSVGKKFRLPKQEAWVQSLGGEEPLEKEPATHSRSLAWDIPWTGAWRVHGVHGVAKSRTRLSD